MLVHKGLPHLEPTQVEEESPAQHVSYLLQKLFQQVQFRTPINGIVTKYQKKNKPMLLLQSSSSNTPTSP